MGTGLADQWALAAGCRDRFGLEPATISAPPVVAITVYGSDGAAGGWKDPRMDLPACTFGDHHEDAKLVLCWGRNGTRPSSRLHLTCLDERGHGYILTLVGRRAAFAPEKSNGSKSVIND